MERPIPLPVDPDHIPPSLAIRHQWVCWKYKWDPRTERWKKPPINPRTGRSAKPNDPSTAGTLQEALERMHQDKLDGIGFLLTADDPYVGIDLDAVVTSEGLAPQAQEILDYFDTYAETSVSGTGIHLIFEYARSFPGGIRHPSVEIYGDRRFLVVTGHTLPNRTTIADCTERFAPWIERFKAESSSARAKQVSASNAIASIIELTDSDRRILDSCRGMGPGFARLFDTGDLAGYGDDHSRADLALLGYFVKAGVDDPESLDRLLRQSALMREKWERADYRDMSIAKALDGTVVAGTCTLNTEASLRREVEIQRQHIRELTNRAERNAEMLEWIAQIMRNRSLKLGASVAIALLRQFASYEDRGATKPYLIPICRIAEATGMSRNTASNHIGRLEAAGLLSTKRVKEHGHTDLSTGEVVNSKTRTYIAPVGTARDFAAGAAAYDGKSNWGGERSAELNGPRKDKRPNLTFLGSETPEPGHNLAVSALTDEAQPA